MRFSQRVAIAGGTNPSGVRSSGGGHSSGGGASGTGRSLNSGPGRGFENAARASPTRRPSCSNRADTVVSDRPSRSIVVATSSAPSPGGEA